MTTGDQDGGGDVDELLWRTSA